jgi:hypothetical protein
VPDYIRLYDAAMVGIVKELFPLAEDRVWFAGRKKSYASIISDLVNGKIISPVCAVQRTVQTYAENRQNRGAGLYAHRSLGAHDRDNNLVVFKRHAPFDFSYQIDMLTKRIQDQNAFLQWYAEHHNDMNYDDFFIEFGEPYSPYLDINCIIHFEEFTDNSDLEPGQEDRVIRNTVTFRMEAWVPRGYHSIKPANRIIVDYCNFEYEPFDGSIELPTIDELILGYTSLLFSTKASVTVKSPLSTNNTSSVKVTYPDGDYRYYSSSVLVTLNTSTCN